MTEFAQPCFKCADGLHDECGRNTCGCIVDHVDDNDITRGFKALKRMLHPERQMWTKGGWDS